MKVVYLEQEKDYLLFSDGDKGLFENPPIRAILQVGVFKKEVEVKFTSEMKRGEIGIPRTLYTEFTLPEELDYHIKINGREIKLGPIIAFIPFNRSKILDKEQLDKALEYFYRYNEIGGLIYICNSRSFHFDTLTIEGYAYIPNSDGREGGWKKGIYPIGNAMYKRVDLVKKVYNQLISIMGDTIFNSYFFDKYELWKYVSDCPRLQQHLPETKEYVSAEDTMEFIDKYKVVYLKPLFSSMARGIAFLQKLEENKYLYRVRYKEDQYYNRKELIETIERLIEEEQYIIQQGIIIKEYKKRRYDFRVIMQKDDSRKWGCTGIITRFGKEDSHITNFRTDGFAKVGYEGLKLGLSISLKDAFVIEQEIITVCKTMCNYLDNTVGNYGDVGFDVVIDENNHIWILEINKLHDHNYPIFALEDEEMYYSLVTKPLLYAKTLAGF